jgi:hypothetical protein
MNKPTYVMLPTYQDSPGFPYKYVCSFSPMLRTVVQALGANLQPSVEAVVKDFEESPELCASLKVYHPEGRIMRQVDLRDDNERILAKCFLWWDWHNKHWVVMMEGDEVYWEKGQINAAAN